MLKKNNGIHSSSFNNINQLKYETKRYLFFTPYEKVIQILNSLKFSILSNINIKKNIEELDWVIDVITNNLLYSYQKTFYFNNNNLVLSGNHKIKDFSCEVNLFNKEFEKFYEKYLEIGMKNEEYAKYLSNNEKNISLLNNEVHKGNNIIFSNQKINSIAIFNKIKKSRHFFNQFSVQLLNDYNQLILGNKSITDIYCTDNNGFKSKIDNNHNSNIKLTKNKKIKELSFDTQKPIINNTNNRNSLYNNYRICSTTGLNSKSTSNRNKNVSGLFENEYLKNNFSLKNKNILSNINLKKNKLFLPSIKYNFNGAALLDKNKIINKKNNSSLNHQNTEIDLNDKSIVLEKEKENMINYHLSIFKFLGIDKDSIFDYRNFDIFKLKDKIGTSNIMPFLGKEIIKKLNINHLLNESKLDNFLITLSKNYHNTIALYHTSVHGTDVCYSIYTILTLLKNKDNIIPDISDLDIASLVIAGLAHDVGHPGLTNKFLINSKNELSIIYNDESILENFHSAKTFQLLNKNDINILDNLSKEEYLLIRKKMIKEIIATDMTFHFKIQDEFQQYIKNKDNKLIQNQLNFIIHLADLSHNYRKFEISIKWVKLLTNEFWNQGDKEKELGLPVSFLCDRNEVNVPKSQVDFINTFLINTIDKLIEININFEIMKKNVINNRKIWEKLQKEKRKTGWSPEKRKIEIEMKKIND